jgi:hypothetical protein
MLKVGPERQLFCARTPSVKWALQYKQSRQTMVETGVLLQGKENSPFRGSMLMTCEACNKRRLGFKGGSRQPSWELRSHNYSLCCCLDLYGICMELAGYTSPFGFSGNCICKCVCSLNLKILVRPLSEHIRRTQRR